MAEPRGNHLNIDGGQVKDDEHNIATYKPVLEFDTDHHKSKGSLTKSREKVSADGAEEKLLQKEDEAKITTRVDMADAKYVVGDHRNGDAKIELDANKKSERLIDAKQTNGAGDIKNTEPSQGPNSQMNRNEHFPDDASSASTSAPNGVRKAPDQPSAGPTEISKWKLMFSPAKDHVQFAGLTKEELMKFADDPFWVRLRWFMFILFWVLWLSMLAGAIAIIVFAPKCAPPPPKTWYQKGPIIDTAPEFASEILEKPELLANIGAIGAQGLIVTQEEPYKVLDDPSALDEIKSIVNKAKELGVKVIVDLSASFVLTDHKWFQLAVNRTGEYANYFIWAVGTDYDEATGHPQPPNNWVSKVNTQAWTWNDQRKEFYYHQFAENKPQLNFTNPDVVKQFDQVIHQYMQAGVAGIRLDARDLLVDPTLPNEQMAGGSSALRSDLSQYAFWRHRHTSDQPGLEPLLQHWAHLVDSADGNNGNTVFTITESGGRPEWYLLNRSVGFLRSVSSAPVELARSARQVAKDLQERTGAHWPSLQLTQDGESNLEVAAFSALLPAAPVLKPNLFENKLDNVSKIAMDGFARLLTLRNDASINHGNSSITAVPSHNSTEELLVCARWKPGHTGYVAVWNPIDEILTADLTTVTSIPPTVTVHYASPDTKAQTPYVNGQANGSDKLLIPPKSTIVFSYVPKTTVEQ